MRRETFARLLHGDPGLDSSPGWRESMAGWLSPAHSLLWPLGLEVSCMFGAETGWAGLPLSLSLGIGLCGVKPSVSPTCLEIEGTGFKVSVSVPQLSMGYREQLPPGVCKRIRWGAHLGRSVLHHKHLLQVVILEL